MKTAFPFALLLALLLAAPAGLAQVTTAPATADAADQDLIATLDARGDFTILVDALRDTGLDAALATGETFTLFAPTDAAFQKLPAGTLESLTPEQLTDILRYHLLAGAVTSQSAAAIAAAPTVQGDDLTLAATAEGQLSVNDATVTEADVQASNGVIHVVDTVLMPGADATMGKASMEEDLEVKDAPMEKLEGDGETASDGEATPDHQP